MKEKALKIIEHYGEYPQLKYFQSEVFELNDAILEKKYFEKYCPEDFKTMITNKKEYTKEEYIKKLVSHIVEETADNMVFLLQFMENNGISKDDILKIMNQKIDRQLGRIKEESDKE